jgi:hypothetical protein
MEKLIRARSFTWKQVPGTVLAGMAGLFIVAMISWISSEAGTARNGGNRTGP